MEIVLSVITVNYNGLNDTCEMIDSITFSDDMEVIVVDNGSAADEASVLERRYPQVRVVRSAQNLGFAGGNNLGIRAARGRYLFFANNDTLLGGSGSAPLVAALHPIIDRMEHTPSIGAVCPKIRFAWGDRPLQFAGYTPLSAVTLRNRSIGFGEDDRGQYDSPHATPYAHGAAMLLRREAVEKAGMMPECYFLYYEELDWSVMLRRAGYEIWYDPSFTVCHKESRTTGQESPLRTYYITRNRLLFARRNIPLPRLLLTLAYLLLAVAGRDMACHALHRRRAHCKAVAQGVSDFMLGKTGRLKMEDGRWKIGDGRWKMEDGRLIED